MLLPMAGQKPNDAVFVRRIPQNGWARLNESQMARVRLRKRADLLNAIDRENNDGE